MRLSSISCIAASSLFAAPVNADTVVDAGEPTPISVRQLDARLDRAISSLKSQAEARSATRAQFYEIVDLLTQRHEASKQSFSKSETVRSRLSSAVEGLYEKAQRYTLHVEDITFLQEQVIDGKLTRAMEQLKGFALSRGATREQFQEVSDLINQRAEMAIDSIDAQSVRSRLISAVSNLQRRAAAAILTHDDFVPFELTVADDKLQRALDHLQKVAKTRGATRVEYNYVANNWSDRAELAGS